MDASGVQLKFGSRPVGQRINEDMRNDRRIRREQTLGVFPKTPVGETLGSCVFLVKEACSPFALIKNRAEIRDFQVRQVLNALDPAGPDYKARLMDVVFYDSSCLKEIEAILYSKDLTMTKVRVIIDALELLTGYEALRLSKVLAEQVGALAKKDPDFGYSHTCALTLVDAQEHAASVFADQMSRLHDNSGSR
ncbi:Uncharacterised protein [Candidatus Burarchaeum australiense]|nr:Uncharacterised protein [Candidatus Burarchaeum australiense]